MLDLRGIICQPKPLWLSRAEDENGTGEAARELRKLVVFSREGLIETLFGFGIGPSRMAIVAAAHRNGDVTIDVAFVAHLAKYDSFHLSRYTPYFANRTGSGFVIRRH
jgi:hypothetical protein